MTFISDILNIHNISNCITPDKRTNKYTNDFFSVCITNIKSRVDFIKLLYVNSDDLYLTRKKELCEKFLEHADIKESEVI